MKEKQSNRDSRWISPELVTRAKEGDQAAFSELYELTNAELYRSIRAMVRDEDLTWDILQDSYLRAFQGLDKLERSEAFLPWLRRIAVNVTATTMAKQKPLTFTDLAGEEDAEPELPDLSVGSQPELALDRKETSRLVREILTGLPREQQLILGMRYYEDLSINEISELLSIAPGTVKSQLHRARKKTETEVCALEKKGVKLYGLAPVAYLMALLRRLEPAAEAEKKALGAVVAQTPAAAEGAVVGTVTALTAGQAFLHGLGTKLMVGVLFAAILVGGKLSYDALKRGDGPRIGDERIPYTESFTPDESSSAPTISQSEPLLFNPTEAVEPVGPTEPTEVPTTAPDEGEYSGVCGADLRWRFDPDTGLLTIEGSGAMDDYEETLTTSTLDTPWEAFQEQIRSVDLPEGLSSVGTGAFRKCSGLTGVEIPDGVTSIGWRAFIGCTGLTHAVIPGSVRAIGASAFQGCDALSELTIREGVAKIERAAFSYCDSLRELTIPDSVTEIGEYAFHGCIGLSSVSIPESVTAIGEQAFAGCEGLRFAAVENPGASIGDTAFSGDSDENLMAICGEPGSTADAFAAESGAPFMTLEAMEELARKDLRKLFEEDTEWEAETIREDFWITRTLSLRLDGSFSYREGRLFSETERSLDGTWEFDAGGDLALTFRQGASDSFTACYACRRTQEGLLLVQQSDDGFGDDAYDTRLEFHSPAETSLSVLDPEELRGIEEQGAWKLTGEISEERITGAARVGERYAAKYRHLVAATVSQEELAQARQKGWIALGKELYCIPRSGLLYTYIQDGALFRMDQNGIDWGVWYVPEPVGDQSYFEWAVGGSHEWIITEAETYWVWLDPDTPVEISQLAEGWPKTLQECGSVPASRLEWDPETGGYYIQVNLEDVTEKFLLREE
jgi:RNA polymerase sigma factor (sigma-70 family)